MRVNKLTTALAVIGLATISSTAFATNGYFAHGYGMKSKGMGGVGIALPQDSLAASANPAGMVSVGNRLDVGIDWFKPEREAKLKPTGTVFDANDTSNFFIPEFGYNKMLNPNMSVGVSVFGNGGMNSDYKTNPGFGTGSAGVNLEQLFIAPTFAMKLNENHAVGIALNLAYQRFSAKGLNGFAMFTPSGTTQYLTDQGSDSSTGAGVRIGWTGQITPTVALGATYQSKTKMSRFDKYKELFAEQGSFDIPSNYGVGISWKATPKLTLAADVMEIKYTDVKAISNPNSATGACMPLGGNNGCGFGWQDMTVYKLGGSYEYSKNLTLRAGFSTTKQPVPASQTTFNVLAPGVVENHATLGATWTLSNNSEVTVSYMHAFENEVKGDGTATGAYDLKMRQNSFGVAYGMKF